MKEDRLQKMDKFVQARADENARRIEAHVKHIKAVRDGIAALAPRITELIETAQALWERGIPIGTRHRDRLGFCEEDAFMSEGIHHRIGFLTAKGYQNRAMMHYTEWFRPEFIGMKGGGCCGKDFVVDKNGDTMPSGYVSGFDTIGSKEWLNKAEEFLAGFDEFERKVYEYVDSL